MSEGKQIFAQCVHCGRDVYIDEFGGDDVIPSGYWCEMCFGYECEGCYHNYEEAY